MLIIFVRRTWSHVRAINGFTIVFLLLNQSLFTLDVLIHKPLLWEDYVVGEDFGVGLVKLEDFGKADDAFWVGVGAF
jgi:hypothetical protein